MGNLREEIEKIRPIYKDLLVLGGEMTTGLISREAVLSLLDEWELVVDEPVESVSTFEQVVRVPEHLRLESLLCRVLKPGDRIAIYRRGTE